MPWAGSWQAGCPAATSRHRGDTLAPVCCRAAPGITQAFVHLCCRLKAEGVCGEHTVPAPGFPGNRGLFFCSSFVSTEAWTSCSVVSVSKQFSEIDYRCCYMISLRLQCLLDWEGTFLDHKKVRGFFQKRIRVFLHFCGENTV